MHMHRPDGEDQHRDARRPRRDRSRADALPMDAAWLDERARSYAARWEASEAGVSRLLERKVRERCERTNESPDSALQLIPAAVARLVDENYVSDQRFARASLERERRKGASTQQIRARLTAKGIPSSILEALFADEVHGVEIASAWALARRRRLGPYCQDEDQRVAARERHLAVLARAGFDYETAREVIDADTIAEPS